MGNTTSSKTTNEGTLPQRNTTTGRFEKTTAKAATTGKPVAAKAKTTTTKPAAKKTKKT